jgi:two-component system, OmpR family, sensor kinase
VSTNADDRRARRAALSVGLFVGVASAVIIATGVAVLLVVILATGRHEGDQDRRPPGPLVGDSFVVDVDRVLPWVIGLGILGVALLAVVGWLAARRAAAPLAAALALQRDFVADASHELRTPLTALSSRIQLLERRHERGQPIDRTLVDLRRDVDAMAELLTDLLLTAEGEGTAPEHPTAIVAAIRQAVGSMSPMAADADVLLELHAEPDALPDALVAVPAVTVTRVAIALIDNAVQHAPAHSTVSIRIGLESGFAAVRVSDEGAGIVGIDPERVFDRFARSAETGRRRGFGIGLALVRQVATRYGGTISIENTSEKGTVFLLRLPAVSASPLPTHPRS